MKRQSTAGIFLLAATCLQAAVLDRIAVTVGNDAITESEVLEEIRVTCFLNNEPLDFSPSARRAAAERLVDQYLIRHELASGTYPETDKQKAVEALRDFEKKNFRSHAAFEAQLKQYGITEKDLQSHLLFQLSAIQFTDLRFSSGASEADRAATPTSSPAAAAPDVDQKLDAWLKQLRSQTRIEFKKGAFE